MKPARPTPPIPIPGNGMPLIDDDVVGALTRDVGMNRLGEVLGAFVSELSRRIPVVRAAVDARDLPVLGRESHSIKGSAMTFGAPALAAAAYRANDAFRRNDAGTLLDASEDVLRRVPETCAAVASLIAAIETNTRDQGKGDAR